MHGGRKVGNVCVQAYGRPVSLFLAPRSLQAEKAKARGGSPPNSPLAFLEGLSNLLGGLPEMWRTWRAHLSPEEGGRVVVQAN